LKDEEMMMKVLIGGGLGVSEVVVNQKKVNPMKG
jgi:hypothetical protein